MHVVPLFYSTYSIFHNVDEHLIKLNNSYYMIINIKNINISIIQRFFVNETVVAFTYYRSLMFSLFRRWVGITTEVIRPVFSALFSNTGSSIIGLL